MATASLAHDSPQVRTPAKAFTIPNTIIICLILGAVITNYSVSDATHVDEIVTEDTYSSKGGWSLEKVQ